jgi:hypothetical protein
MRRTSSRRSSSTLIVRDFFFVSSDARRTRSASWRVKNSCRIIRMCAGDRLPRNSGVSSGG